MRETEGLIKAGMEGTSNDMLNEISRGTDTSGLLHAPDSTNQNLNYGDQGLSSAIRGKYSKPFQVEREGFQNKMQLDARNAHFEKIKVAHDLANQEAQLNFQKEMTKYKQKMAKRQQRQAIVGAVLGLGGGIVGGAVGGPAGAVAGSQVAPMATGAATK